MRLTPNTNGYATAQCFHYSLSPLLSSPFSHYSMQLHHWTPPQEALTFLTLSAITELFGKWKLSFPAMESMVHGSAECPVFSKPHRIDWFCGRFWGRRGQMASTRCRDCLRKRHEDWGMLVDWETRKEKKAEAKTRKRFISVANNFWFWHYFARLYCSPIS